jgi:conjugative relaxase-like TrwC/TraI family protein
MLSPKTQYSLTNAKSYFEEHLSVGDYYSEGERVGGEWFGKGAELLGLSGAVKSAEFLSLCDNLDPRTGRSLTVRQKTTRREEDADGSAREVANRRVFYDFTLSPPKSVSIVALVGGDNRIVKAHDHATRVALGELEKFAATRVRSAGASSDRATSNVVAAVFRHDTSRALDPHLHSHCILFNATHDAAEGRWKALQNFAMLQARKYVENVYYHELARELHRCGYEIVNHARGDFQIRGVAPALCDLFSKRHREIDERTRELMSREPGLASGNLGDVREHIAHNERSRKIKDVATERLRGMWEGQLSADEGKAMDRLLAEGQSGSKPAPAIATGEAVAWAEEHIFDRSSVVLEHEIWRHSLERARGAAISLGELHAATAAADYLRQNGDARRLTTREVLGREWDIVCLAKAGVGKCRPLSSASAGKDAALDEAQRLAVARILTSRDFVTLFRGGAGTGKSFTLRAVDVALRSAGHSTLVVAPQRQQVKDLERDGFAGAQTVSESLTRKELPVGAVLIVDEAGQLGAKQMLELLRFAKANDARVILSGDTRQHGAVEASDALRAIERFSNLRAAELNEIRRQDPERGRTADEKAWIAEYRSAVKDAANGDIAASFDRLEQAGAIVQCTLADQQERLAEAYLSLAAENLSTVVVSQTWSEIRKVNERVRADLQAAGRLGPEEWRVRSLQTVDLSDAQKRDARFYGDGAVIVLNRDSGGFRKGQSGSLVAITKKGAVVEADGKVRTVAFNQVDRLTVCRADELTLSRGDRLQLKANAKAVGGERVANGELVTVERVIADGRIRLQDGRTLESDYRQFVRGYAVTSYGSQGKTVDHVLFSDSTVRAATNAQQWYVTISRGRRGIRIFTSDKAQLRESVTRSGERPLALDLAPQGVVRLRAARMFGRGLRRAREIAAAVQRHVANFTRLRRARAAQQRVGLSVT